MHHAWKIDVEAKQECKAKHRCGKMLSAQLGTSGESELMSKSGTW
jgi:hypothetical protein